MNATTTVTDIERAAVTILSQSLPRHPWLTWWVDSLALHPDESRSLATFAQAAPAVLPEYGYPTVEPTNAFQAITNGGAYPAPSDADDSPLTTDEARRVKLFDRAIALLAQALVTYRKDGRPDGDQTAELPDAVTVTTSLSAAVAEYVQAIQNIWAGELRRVRP